MGGEEVLFNSKGKSQISYADYAIAMIDEAETAKHVKQRFTVATEWYFLNSVAKLFKAEISVYFFITINKISQQKYSTLIILVVGFGLGYFLTLKNSITNPSFQNFS